MTVHLAVVHAGRQTRLDKGLRALGHARAPAHVDEPVPVAAARAYPRVALLGRHDELQQHLVRSVARPHGRDQALIVASSHAKDVGVHDDQAASPHRVGASAQDRLEAVGGHEQHAREAQRVCGDEVRGAVDIGLRWYRRGFLPFVAAAYVDVDGASKRWQGAMQRLAQAPELGVRRGREACQVRDRLRVPPERRLRCC